MKVVVIGGGIVGATTAATLAKRGHDVTVVEQFTPATQHGSSFANGGQLSACHAAPWANPSAPLKVVKWALGAEDSPLLFRPRTDVDQVMWLTKFLWNCLPSKTEHNTKAILSLALYSREARKILQVGMDKYRGSNCGILHFYRTKSELKSAERSIELMASNGLDRHVVSPAEAVKIEPALKPISNELAGATWTPSDSAGDCAEFTQYLLSPEWRIKRGVKGTIKVLKTSACGITQVGEKAYVQVCADSACKTYVVLDSDAVVVAAGCWSNEILRPLGINLAIEPARGFSTTLSLETIDGKKVKGPHVSLTDDERKLVYTRLGNDLRIAGTAALTGFREPAPNFFKQRIDFQTKSARETFGLPDGLVKMTAWSGLRPLTPSNRPYVCSTHISNLYLNAGHGSLGWTTSAGSAVLLADIIDGNKPAIDQVPFSLEVPH